MQTVAGARSMGAHKHRDQGALPSMLTLVSPVPVLLLSKT